MDAGHEIASSTLPEAPTLGEAAAGYRAYQLRARAVVTVVVQQVVTKDAFEPPCPVELRSVSDGTSVGARCLKCSRTKCAHARIALSFGEKNMPKLFADAKAAGVEANQHFELFPDALGLHEDSGWRVNQMPQEADARELARIRAREKEPRRLDLVLPFGAPECCPACKAGGVGGAAPRLTAVQVEVVTRIGVTLIQVQVPLCELRCDICRHIVRYSDFDDACVRFNGFLVELEWLRDMLDRCQYQNALFNQMFNVEAKRFIYHSVVSMTQVNAHDWVRVKEFPTRARLRGIFYRFLAMRVETAGAGWGAFTCPRCPAGPGVPPDIMMIDATSLLADQSRAHFENTPLTAAVGAGVRVHGSTGGDYMLPLTAKVRDLILRAARARVGKGKPPRKPLDVLDNFQLKSGFTEKGLVVLWDCVEAMRQKDPERKHPVHRAVLADMAAQTPSPVIAAGGDDTLLNLFTHVGERRPLSLEHIVCLKKLAPIYGQLIDWVGQRERGGPDANNVVIPVQYSAYFGFLAKHASDYWAKVEATMANEADHPKEALPELDAAHGSSVRKDLSRGIIVAPQYRSMRRALDDRFFRQDGVSSSPKLDRDPDAEHSDGASCHRSTVLPPTTTNGAATIQCGCGVLIGVVFLSKRESCKTVWSLYCFSRSASYVAFLTAFCCCAVPAHAPVLRFHDREVCSCAQNGDL